MNENKDNFESVSDAPTIVGKPAMEIQNEVRRVIDEKKEDDAPAETAEAVPEQEEETPAESSEDDFDDFDAKPENDTEDQKIPETANEEMTEKKHSPIFTMRALKILLLIIGALVALFFLAVILGLTNTSSDTVSKNVFVGELNVGGLSYNDALASIEASDLMSHRIIKLQCGDNYYTFNGIDVGSSANAEDTAKRAFEYGKSGNFIKDGMAGFELMFKKRTLSPPATLDEERLAVVLRRFGTDIYGELQQHQVSFDGASAIVTPGHTGFDNEVDTAVSEVKAALAKGVFDAIPVTLKSAPPYDFTVDTFDHICYVDPVNAQYAVSDNKVEIIPDQNGRYINKEEVAPYLSQIKEGGGTVTVPICISYADVTAAMLQEKLFNATLGSYSTNYGGSTSNRSANIARAASLLNGKVIAPGEVFSFNDTVGPRTTGNGFYTAKEYVNGQSVDGIGGGTCQVSTTLYSAVLYADLGIVSRENHMMTIGYAPLGQDATVAYGSVDFKFRNTTDAPVKIAASTGGGTITVKIIGTAWTPAREVKLSHSTSHAGENTVVTSVRRVYSNGELISTDKLGTSVYQPHK